nr:retrovirus-related Pol polyprotein from transposon TNT 1-94 [Tanacetum cinerariifolium]
MRDKVQAEYHVLELQPEGHFQNMCSKLVASKDKEVNMAARDSDDALVFCVENTVKDRIMDFDASFNATYCKEELERFKLRSDKAHSRPREKVNLSWQLDEKVTMIDMSMLDSKGNVPDVRKIDVYFYKPGGLGKQKNLSFILLVKTRNCIDCSRSCDSYNANLQFGVTEILSRTFRAESTWLRVESPKLLWGDSISTTYLIYHIPYFSIGLRIPEEEWRGKDTSLTHLKVFGCDSFVKVKDVCREAIKCTFIGSRSDEVRYSFRDTKSHQVIRSRDITFVDSICGARYATNSSSLTKLIDTSEGSKNSKSFEDSGRLDEEYSKDGQALRLYRYEDPPESLELQ